MSLKLVPFNPVWIAHEKIDIKAMYRRPRFVTNKYGELERELDKDGVPTWDLTGALPLKQHNKWLAKGYQYVTLSDRESLYVAARFGTVLAPGEDGTLTATNEWKALYDQHQTGGPWNYRKYDEGLSKTTTREAEELLSDVNTFGSMAVETLRRRGDPFFRLPEHLRGIEPGGKKAAKVEPKPDRVPA